MIGITQAYLAGDAGSSAEIISESSPRMALDGPRLARRSGRLRQPQDAADRLGIANAAVEGHPLRLRQGKESGCDPLVRFRLSNARLQSPGQVDGHGFVQEAGTHVEVQNSLPLEGAVACFFEQLALGR